MVAGTYSAAFTETKKKGTGTKKRVSIFIYTARSGVSRAVKKQYKRNIKSWDYINERILQVEMTKPLYL